MRTPSSADVIPAVLQDQSARFPFGRLQSQAFLQRVGAHTIIRGHEKVEEGFKRVYDDGQQLLITLFSAGGKDNNDLPEDSSYRDVVPMALTLDYAAGPEGSGQAKLTPWKLQYEWYNSADRNAFRLAPAEIEHRS